MTWFPPKGMAPLMCECGHLSNVHSAQTAEHECHECHTCDGNCLVGIYGFHAMHHFSQGTPGKAGECSTFVVSVDYITGLIEELKEIEHGLS